jgi:hypothetical protein
VAVVPDLPQRAIARPLVSAGNIPENGTYQQIADLEEAVRNVLRQYDDKAEDNQRLRVAIALAIGRIERHEPGAALTGLRAALDG